MWQKVAKFKGAEYFRKALYITSLKSKTTSNVHRPSSFLASKETQAKMPVIKTYFQLEFPYQVLYMNSEAQLIINPHTQIFVHFRHQLSDSAHRCLHLYIAHL